MSAFRYEAVDALGTTQKGVVDADSARAARSELRGQGLTPIVVDSIRRDAAGRSLRSFGDKLSTPELALFTRQLASLLEASLPLEQAFSALLEQAERTYVRDLIASIRSEIMSGSSLSMRCRSIRPILQKFIARWFLRASKSASCHVSCRAW